MPACTTRCNLRIGKDYMFLHVQIFNQTLCEMELGRDNKGFEI